MYPALLGSFLWDVLRSTGLALLAVVVVCTVLLASQVLAMAPVSMDLGSSIRVALGLLPSALMIALPVAVLIGMVAAGQAWAEGGDWRGLGSAGIRGARLLPVALVLGVGGSMVHASLAHLLAPRGHAQVRLAFQEAGELALRAGQPAVFGDVLVVAGEVQEQHYGDIFLASGSVVVAASSARLAPGSVLELVDGMARKIDVVGDEALASLTFSRARLPLRTQSRRIELVERSDSELWQLITRMEARGRDAAFERLCFYKRSTLPLSVLMLALFGLPLGFQSARPALVAAGVGLGWWVATRLCDHGVGLLGPLLSASLPLLGLAVAAGLSWSRWPDR